MAAPVLFQAEGFAWSSQEPVFSWGHPAAAWPKIIAAITVTGSAIDAIQPSSPEV
jgi:hypothetical protein